MHECRCAAPQRPSGPRSAPPAPGTLEPRPLAPAPAGRFPVCDDGWGDQDSTVSGSLGHACAWWGWGWGAEGCVCRAEGGGAEEGVRRRGLRTAGHCRRERELWARECMPRSHSTVAWDPTYMATAMPRPGMPSAGRTCCPPPHPTPTPHTHNHARAHPHLHTHSRLRTPPTLTPPPSPLLNPRPLCRSCVASWASLVAQHEGASRAATSRLPWTAWYAPRYSYVVRKGAGWAGTVAGGERGGGARGAI